MSDGITVRTQVVLCLLMLFVVVGLESWTDMDMAVQRLLYADGWPVTRAMHHGWLGLLLYQGPKIALVVFGGLCVLGVGAALAAPLSLHGVESCGVSVACFRRQTDYEHLLPPGADGIRRRTDVPARVCFCCPGKRAGLARQGLSRRARVGRVCPHGALFFGKIGMATPDRAR